MTHSGMDSTERGEQTCPGVTPAFQHFFAVLVSDFLQLLPQRGDGVVIVIQSLSQVQQTALFGREEKNKSHHDRQSRVVKAFLIQTLEQQASTILIELIKGLNQYLHRIANLIPQLIRD